MAAAIGNAFTRLCAEGHQENHRDEGGEGGVLVGFLCPEGSIAQRRVTLDLTSRLAPWDKGQNNVFTQSREILPCRRGRLAVKK